jgi:hypothetical protein
MFASAGSLQTSEFDWQEIDNQLAQEARQLEAEVALLNCLCFSS